MTLSTKIKTKSSFPWFIVLFCLCFKLVAQSTTQKELIAKMKNLQTLHNIAQVDSMYKTMKDQALELGLDSLYLEMTFQQIEKSGELQLYTNAEFLLDNLMIKENYMLSNHPKLLLRCFHTLAQLYLTHSWSSEVMKEISEHYYDRYFKLIKKIELSPAEQETAKLNKLSYLAHTKNDSLLYYLGQFKLEAKDEARFLNHWYREKNDEKNELIYAKILDDKIKIISALKNNKQYAEVKRLYPIYLKELKSVNLGSEHKLYLVMGQVYTATQRYRMAEEMYVKALRYFEPKKSYFNTNIIYNDLIKIKLKLGDIDGYSYYSNKLLEQNKNYENIQLAVLKNHLDYHAELSDIEIKQKLGDEKLTNDMLNNKIKNQKAFISFALALLIVTLIFVYFYSASSKTKAELEDANKQMVIDVLRSKFKPHFTFNVLSVINYFVEKKEIQNATLALTKMSSLLRSTLDNMNERLVPFISEYNICQNYMYLESLRFSDKFEYEFEPIKNMSVEQWMIPPGIIEPFLENAVNHAFTGIKYKGKISLRHKFEDKKLIIIVEDNGVGLKLSTLKNKKSHGLKITKDYIATTSKLYKSPISLNISSKEGTRIEITIPKLNQNIVS